MERTPLNKQAMYEHHLFSWTNKPSAGAAGQSADADAWHTALTHNTICDTTAPCMNIGQKVLVADAGEGQQEAQAPAQEKGGRQKWRLIRELRNGAIL